MKEKLEKEIETFVYGMLSLIFGMAFFFGVLYPDHGISPRACHVENRETESVAQPYDRQRSDLWEEIYYCDRSRIRYKLYFYERFKNS